MKRIVSLALALAMLSAVLTGCGCMDRTVSEHPSGVITDPTTMPTILPTPTATHQPEESSLPRATDPTGNGTEATGENSSPTDTTVDPRATGRARNGMR